MKKTVSANISGKLFTLNDDAYRMLEQYLCAKSSAHATAANADVFEARVCELLEQRGPNHIIELADIHYIISVLGPAPQGNEANPNFSGKCTNRQSRRQTRRIYRDTDNRAIGGVCSGLAAYFDTDTALMRILFVIFLLVGFGFLAYLILWIALPKAVTPEQIAELYGYARE